MRQALAFLDYVSETTATGLEMKMALLPIATRVRELPSDLYGHQNDGSDLFAVHLRGNVPRSEWIGSLHCPY